MINKAHIVAIVVTYHPQISALECLLNVLDEQVDSIVLVDNGSGLYLAEFIASRRKPKEFLITLGANFGVAAAHNAGIEWARRNGKRYVVLFDQDSVPAPDMISHLISALHKLTDQGIRVAAVGPSYQDIRNIKHPSFIKARGFQVNKIECRSPFRIVESDVIISSGSLIPLSTLEEVGGPLDELFIDQVDMEWCFRAKSKGYSVFGVCDAMLHHSLGESPKNFLGRKFVHQSPLRHYYIFRNAVWLLFKKHTPPSWKFLFIRSIFFRFIVYVCLISPRAAYFKMMTKGILHGLNGCLGKLQTKSIKS
ncbi:MAG: glycosyltransferase family 2 protein [Desulfococcus multivorans]|jgi:rhamnosyltransferase|nr:glycosyltransferase family 2 protein [Desulfococcus multivorans]